MTLRAKRIAVGTYEIVTGAVDIGFAIGLLATSDWHRKGLVAACLIAYGAIKIVAGIGFLREKSWGYYLVLGLLVMLLPPDLYRFFLHPGPGIAALLAIHLTILLFMAKYRSSLVHKPHYDHDRHGKPEQTEGATNDVSGT